MKKFLAVTIASLAFLPLIAMAYTSPGKPQGYVSDFAHVLSASDVQSIDAKLQAFQSSTGDQIAVVTVPTVGQDETIESYAVQLFEEWGIGMKGKDNGVLILVAMNDRKVRIEVGYGLEGDITDLQANNIIQKVMLPAFKAGDYSGGVNGAVDAVTGIISRSPEANQYLDSNRSSSDGDPAVSGIIWFVFIFGVVFLNGLARILGKTKSWWLGGVIGAGVGTIVGLIWGFVSAGIVAIVVLTILGLIFDFIVSKRPPGSGSGRGGGFWPIFFGGRGGFGGGGGGFGGFGGGGSGGGGASGGW